MIYNEKYNRFIDNDYVIYRMFTKQNGIIGKHTIISADGNDYTYRVMV